jgi:hypothetical protein
MAALAREIRLCNRTFHDDPKLFGGPFHKGKNVRDGADDVRHEPGSYRLDRHRPFAINPFEADSYRFHVLGPKIHLVT